MSDYKREDDISSHPPQSCVCLFWLQHLQSLSFPFWYVFSDYKRGDDISSHPPPSCVCLFWLHNLPSLSFPFWYVFSDYKRGDDISSHPPPSCVCLFWLPPGCWKHGGDLEKDLAVLAARLRSQRNVRVRFYYIHFKELESRYMSPIQGILVGFHIIIHIPPTKCTMMCILYYHNLQLWTRSESLGKTYCVICGLGTCGWFTMSLTKLIWYTVLWYEDVKCPEDVCRKFVFLRLDGIVHHWCDLRDPSVIEEVRPSTS